MYEIKRMRRKSGRWFLESVFILMTAALMYMSVKLIDSRQENAILKADLDRANQQIERMVVTL